MPIFKYHCKGCDSVFEYYELNKTDVCECHDPEEGGCGSKDIEKVLTTAAFSLKGGGWFKDGYSSAPSSIPDRGEQVSKIRQMAKEEHLDGKSKEDKEMKEKGYVRVGTQRLENDLGDDGFEAD